MVEITIDVPGDVIKGKTDSRGRLNLGTELADMRVEVAILETEEPEAQPAN
jgi:hypothetical protein